MSDHSEPLLVQTCRALRKRMATVASARGVGSKRPELFPEELWQWVEPAQKALVMERYANYTEDRLRELISELLVKLEIFFDDKVGVKPPWILMEELVAASEATHGSPREQDYFRAQALANLDIFGAPDPDNPPRVKGHQIRIETEDERPCRARPRRFNLIQQACLEAKTNIMVRQHKLKDTQSAWSHGLVLVPYHDRIQRFLEKHGESSTEQLFNVEHEAEVSTFYRLCSDMREINKKTKLDIFPLPRIDDILDNVQQGTDRFSTGDLMDAFFCVEVHPDDRHKLAFRTHNRHLEFEVLVMGWINSPSHFSRIIAAAMDGIGRFKASAYMDDVLNHTGGFAAHFRTQQNIYDRLRANQLIFKITKTKINFPSIRWLGHILSVEGRAPDPAKVEAIKNLEDPRDVTGVRSLLGMALFYRSYIPNFGDIAMPLHALTKKGINVKKVWKDTVHGVAVDEIKKALCEAPVLRLFDSTKPVQIRIDACKVGRGIGAILLQQDDEGEWHPVEYYSTTLSETERNYAATELECKALHDSLMHWHMYVNCGQRVDVYSDHNALRYMVTKATATNNGRLLHWLMDIQGYRFNLHYKMGVLHSDADFISRAWHITDFIHESREELDSAIGVYDPKELKEVERGWGAVNRKLKKYQKVQMNMLRRLDITTQIDWREEDGEERVVSQQEAEVIEEEDNAEDMEGTRIERSQYRESLEQQTKDMRWVERGSLISHHMQDIKMLHSEQEVWPWESCQDSQGWTKELHQEVEERNRDKREVKRKVKKMMSGRVLRSRPQPVDYLQEEIRPCRADWRTAEEHAASAQLVLTKKLGYKVLKVMKSTIANAEWGLFASAEIAEGDYFCSYEGAELPEESSSEEHYSDYVAVGEEWVKKVRGVAVSKGRSLVIDSWDQLSCFGRYANDLIDEDMVNAKIVWTKDGLRLIATMPILPGQEIFVSYGKIYWAARKHMLDAESLERLEEWLGTQRPKVRFNPEVEVRVFKGTEKTTAVRPPAKSPLQPSAKSPKISALERQEQLANQEAVRIRELELEMECFEKYAYDGVIQCEELASELQYLVGRVFVDPDNGGRYEVSLVEYNEEFKVVVGGKRSLDGKLRKYDDSLICVFGREGIMEMTDNYVAHHPTPQAWPSTAKEMRDLQQLDAHLAGIITACLNAESQDEPSEIWVINKTSYFLAKGKVDERILMRREYIERKAEWIDQIVLPEILWKTCMTMFHEGYSHPGSQRCLETIKLDYFWESLRKDTIEHVASCMPCRLRKSYQGRPAVPIMKYPAAQYPLERLHMDITGMLPTSPRGNVYIFVVKDHLTKFVWLFPLKSKRAEDIAEVLVEKLFCTFGMPQNLFSDKGTEFVNRLIAKISLLLQVNRISTTPYNPRSNGFVENHNKTLKDQLYHFVGVLQETWDQFLPTVQLMYNTTVSSATQFTPFFLMFGRECKLACGELLTAIQQLPVGRAAQDDVEVYVNKLTLSLECAWEYAVGRAEKNFHRFNAVPKYKRKFREYAAGDQFMRERRPVYEFKSADDEIKYHINAKLQARFDGPHRVIRKLSPILYDVEIEGEEKRISAVNMKPLHSGVCRG
jgi:hypothetical protein